MPSHGILTGKHLFLDDNDSHRLEVKDESHRQWEIMENGKFFPIYDFHIGKRRQILPDKGWNG